MGVSVQLTAPGGLGGRWQGQPGMCAYHSCGLGQLRILWPLGRPRQLGWAGAPAREGGSPTTWSSGGFCFSGILNWGNYPARACLGGTRRDHLPFL